MYTHIQMHVQVAKYLKGNNCKQFSNTGKYTATILQLVLLNSHQLRVMRMTCEPTLLMLILIRYSNFEVHNTKCTLYWVRFVIRVRAQRNFCGNYEL
jgi:hypothetical protein